MRFCPDHWERLREAIKARGLYALVADSGEQAAKNLVSELADGSTIDNFDPLMGAHNAIVAQAMDIIPGQYKQNPMMLFADPDEHPEWACPICALNWCHEEHDRLCTVEDCTWPKGFDWSDDMITGAADHMATVWTEIGDK